MACNLNDSRAALLRASVGAMALIMAINAAPSAAQECLLDTNDDGVVGAGDTDGGATADPNDALACGEKASCRQGQAGSHRVSRKTAYRRTG